MRRFPHICALILGSVLIASAASAESVTIENGSSYDIYHLFLSPMDNDDWGPDQLRDAVIESGGSFTLEGIPCDDYDVRLVDEDGDECILGAPDICGDDEVWSFDDDGLLACEGFGE